MAEDFSFWNGRKVFITGHTGFKGSWLSLWLSLLGAKVYGYALDPPSDPSLFDVADVASVLSGDVRADIADMAALHDAILAAAPEVVFHMAAQSLVRESYAAPLYTFATNIMGSANLLEAVRRVKSVRAVVVVTSDKVYQNLEQGKAFHEGDPLGGHDPYSASKAAAEIISESYRKSFFSDKPESLIRVATARSGNVIGGGDWSADRLVPDCLRAFAEGESAFLRYPQAVRPWQHALDPLSGYLKLAENLLGSEGAHIARAWNFGPDKDAIVAVSDVARMVAGFWDEGKSTVKESSEETLHEAGILLLDSSCARNQLGWRPIWAVEQAVLQTVSWHREWINGSDMKKVTLAQIEAYNA